MQISRQCVKFNPTYQKDMDQVTMKKMNERARENQTNL